MPSVPIVGFLISLSAYADSLEFPGLPHANFLDLTPTETPRPTVTPTILLGDTNGDSNIDIVDALLTAQYFVGLDPANFNPSAADVNCDDSVDIVDALLMAQYYVGIITEFSGCSTVPIPSPVP